MCEFCKNIVELQYANQIQIVKDGNQYHIADYLKVYCRHNREYE